MTKPIILLMGPPGSGKTTLGLALSARLDWPFADGDDLHPAANIAKMSAGEPLDDAARAPWLAAIGETCDGWTASGLGGVVTCSALKRAYRDTLRAGRPHLRIVYIRGELETLRERVTTRPGHFMPPSLLADQLRVLEPPGEDEGALTIAAELPTEAQVDRLVKALALG